MNWRKIRRLLIVMSAILLVAFVGVSWFVAGELVAPVMRTVGPPPDDLPVESVTIPSGSLAAWYIHSDHATATVILLHPIRGDRRSMLGRAQCCMMLATRRS